MPVADASERSESEEPGFDLVDEGVSLTKRVRLALTLMAMGFVAVFWIAAHLKPYNEDGTPKRNAVHTQLGLEPCGSFRLIGKPCPTCGMTTSFALLVRGDVANSMRANWVGTLLAVVWFFLIPWSLLAASRGRFPWVKSGEMFGSMLVIGLTILMFIRWIVVIST